MSKLALVTPEGQIVGKTPTAPLVEVETKEPTLADIAAREAQKQSTKKQVTK